MVIDPCKWRDVEVNRHQKRVHDHKARPAVCQVRQAAPVPEFCARDNWTRDNGMQEQQGGEPSVIDRKNFKREGALQALPHGIQIHRHVQYGPGLAAKQECHSVRQNWKAKDNAKRAHRRSARGDALTYASDDTKTFCHSLPEKLKVISFWVAERKLCHSWQNRCHQSARLATKLYLSLWYRPG